MKTLTSIQIVLCIIWISSSALAQDGEKLFKSRCSSCHMIDKNSTGPALKGAKAKWEAAGEGSLLYDWVMNSTNVIAEGTSQSAKAIQGFSPTVMPQQVVTKAEIDAVFTYIDTYIAPVATNTTSAGSTSPDSEKKVIKKPNYASNLTFFYFLLLGIVIQIIAIMILSGTVGRFIKSDFFRDKIAKGTVKKGILVLIVSLYSLTPNNLMAFTLRKAGEGDPTQPWLLIENEDLYALAAINIALLMVVIYLRSLFTSLMEMVVPKKEEATKVAVVNIKKINAILTDAVDIEEEHTILMDHEYDGIRELDNNLPPWWVWGFVATIIFAVTYLINYHVLGTSDLQIQAYNKEKAQAKIEVDAYLKKMALNVDETNVTTLTSLDAINAGKSLYKENCVSCHMEKGEGQTGPNLTDKQWIYGFDIKEVFKSIKQGRPNGMPEHASKFNPVQIQQVASYILSMPETKGKESQGAILEK
jgi:cytochrome c oxidase cbb3-type subunit 3